MNACVDKLKTRFLEVIEDNYNTSVYFIESCLKFPTKYGSDNYLMDLSLNIFFEENNKIFLEGKLMKYCSDDSKRKIKLTDISNDVNLPEVNVVNNYLVDDKWEKIDW